MTLPDDITAAVLAYHAAHLTDRACFMAYERAHKELGEGSGGEVWAAVEDLGRKCDAAYDARRAAQTALLQAIESMETTP